MSTLTGKKLDEVYHSLLKIDGNSDLSSTLQYIVDAQGNSSGIQVSTAGDMVATGDVTAAGFTGDLTGNADTATRWLNARTITIGDTGKSVDGTANVTWSKAEIGYDLQDVTDNGATTTNGITVANMLVSATAPLLDFVDTNSFTDPNDRFRIRAAGDVGQVRWWDDSAGTDTVLATFSPYGDYSILGNITASGGVLNLYQNKIDGSTDNLKISADYNNVSGSSTIEFLVDGSEKMRIDNSGNVGIGTQTAAGSNGKGLAIYTSDYPRLTFRNSTTGDGATDGTQFVAAGSDFEIYNKEAGALILGTSNLERMRIDSNGRVGIGISSPNYNLTSYKVGANANFIQVANGSTGVGAANGTLFGVDASGNGEINVQGAFALKTFVAGIERMRIDSSGNVRFYTNGSETVRVDSSGHLWALNRLYVGTGGGYFYNDSSSRIRTDQDFYTNNSNTYLYANNLYLGNTSGDSVQVRGNRMYGYNWSIETDGAMIFQGSYVTNQNKIRNIDEDNYFRINDDTTREELVEQWGGLSGGSISNIAKVDDNTAPAVGCFELTGPIYADAQGDFIKVDQNSDYTWEMWVKYVSGSDTDSRLYLGWNMYNSGKSSFGNNQRYWGQVGTQFDADSNNNGWYKITGTISGVGSGYGKFISGTEYVKPVLLLNYNGGSNKIRVCGFKLYRSEKRATELILTRKGYLNFYSDSQEAAALTTGYARIANDGADDVVINDNKVFREFGSVTGTAYNSTLEILMPAYAGGIRFKRTSGVGTAACSFINESNSTVGSITINSTTTTYSTTSDYRVKENIVTISDGIDRLKLLKPSRFNFIGHTEVVDGFIAHEAQEVVPQAVTGEKDAVGFDGEPIYQGIDQSKLVPLLTAALQEAVAKIEALEERITILENN